MHTMLLIKSKFVSKLSELKDSALDITFESVKETKSKSVKYGIVIITFIYEVPRLRLPRLGDITLKTCQRNFDMFWYLDCAVLNTNINHNHFMIAFSQ